MAAPDCVIIGSNGMLGRELLAACRRRHLATRSFADPQAMDITDQTQVRRSLSETPASLVLNAAGYADVDGSETHRELADRVNREGPANLARVCREIGATLVHYSTDYVFDGRAERPYRIDDVPNPVNEYGRSKLAGEQEIAVAGSRHLIIRTSWLFAAHGRNFVRTILDLAGRRSELDVVDDQRGRPTFAADLADTTLDLLDHGAEGLFHAANDGQCSWFELASTIVEQAGLDCRVRPCVTGDMPRPAARPPFSVLDLSSTMTLVGPPRHWAEALKDCLEQLTADRATNSP